MPTRTASAHWSGDLTSGKGAISTETGTLSDTPYSFDTRFKGEGTGTNPEELLGAAHAACFTMQLSHLLAEAGHPPTKAETTAKVLVQQAEGGGFEIPKIDLVLEADVPGITEAKFREIADTAKTGCPLSKVLRAAEITLDATLTSS